MAETKTSTYTQAPPLPSSTVALLINNFVLNTSRFLNSFVKSADEKLAGVSSKISNVETMMTILEAKLASVPDVDPGTSTSADASASASASAPAPASSTPQQEQGTNESDIAAPAAEAETAIVPAADPNQIAVSQHPDYSAFFKQLKVGAPLPAVQMKVAAAGLDPSMLEMEPDTMIPYDGGGEEEGEAE
mmetsp:Transcript_12984/g.26528  ORF Transcript_12984/g.26528 Transcript_12984/m.26528 type:complete len:190 (-) Transcript_12984:45-614(-)